MDKMRVEEGWIEVIPVYELENYISNPKEMYT